MQSYPKVSKCSSERTRKPRKRRFHGNPHTHGHTQNANESFNSTVWRMSPKHLHSGIKIVEIAASIAGGMFNEGCSAALKTMQLLDLKIGQQCNNFAERADKERVTRENRSASFSSKEARTLWTRNR